MSTDGIRLLPEVLDSHLKTFEGHVDELNTIATDVLSLTFGSSGDNESAGPCSGKANDLNKTINEICVGMAALIEGAITHLRDIRDDIIEADSAQGGA